MTTQNRQGIDNFLTSSKLFQKDKPTFIKISPNYNNKQLDYVKNGFNHHRQPKNYQYHLLNQSNGNCKISNEGTTQLQNLEDSKINKQNTGNENEINNGKLNRQIDPNFDINQPQQQQLNQSNELQSSTITNNIKHPQPQNPSKQKQLNPATINPQQKKKPIKIFPSHKNTSTSKLPDEEQSIKQIPLEEHSSNIWSSIVIKSSLKYFTSCRGQATDYITKIQQILTKDKSYLNQSLSKIRYGVEEAHLTLAQKLKQYLYRVADQSVNKWREFSLEQFHKLEILYIGELLEIRTKVEEQYKQITICRNDLDDEKCWKKIASDLLTSNYENEIIQLSKLCKKNVECSQLNVKNYVEAMNKIMVAKVQEKQFENMLSQKICQYLIHSQNSHSQPKQQQHNKKQISIQNIQNTSKQQTPTTNQLKKQQKSPNITKTHLQPNTYTPQTIATCNTCFHYIYTPPSKQFTNFSRIQYQETKFNQSMKLQQSQISNQTITINQTKQKNTKNINNPKNKQ